MTSLWLQDNTSDRRYIIFWMSWNGRTCSLHITYSTPLSAFMCWANWRSCHTGMAVF